jgi:hypothetical protein
LTYNEPTAGALLIFNMAQGLDFAVQTSACGATQCTAQVAFTPLYPGLLDDAVLITDVNGNSVGRTFVYGTGLAAQFGYELGTDTIYENFQGHPAGVAIGPDENYYIADPVAKTVIQYAHDFSSGNYVPFTNLGLPSGLAVDGAGTVYLGDQVNDVVYAYSKAGVQSTVTTSALSSPTGLAVDGTGALYIADTNHNRVIKIDNQGSETSVATGLTAPQGIAVDAAGNVYIADGGNGGEILEVLVAGGTPPQDLGDTLGAVQGVAVDAAGRVYYTNAEGLGILSPNFNSSEFFCGGQCDDGPFGIVIDQNGDVFTSQTNDGNFIISDRYSGNFILSAAAGSTSQGGLTVSNTGNTGLGLSGLSVGTPEFSIDPSTQCTSDTTLGAGETCGVTIDFTPPDNNSYQDTLSVTSNSLNTASTNPFILYGQGQTNPTTTSLSASSNSINAGQSVTFTATVAPQSYTTEPSPTGSVAFMDNGTATLGTVTIGENGPTVTYTTATLAGGPHSITAVYQGSPVYSPSTSAPQTVTVAPGLASTTTSFTVSAPSITAGQTETLTATVQTTGTTAPTGMVTFNDQNGYLGSANLSAPTAGGTATVSLSNLTVGSHTITATYGGDTNYAASTSTAKTVTVVAGTTTTTLSVSAASISATQPETLSVFIQTTSTLPTGSVSFSDQHGVLGSATATPGEGGSNASLTLTNLSVGSHQITANYLGDANNLTSSSQPQTVTVTALPTTVTLTVSAPAITAGQTEMLTANVQGATTPAETGNVTFSDQYGTLGAAVVTPTSTGSTASISYSSLSSGPHQIIAVYSGDINFASSTSAPQTVTVSGGTSPAGTTTTLSITPGSATYTQPVTFSASVATTSEAAVTAGQVIFCNTAATICNQLQNLAVAQLTSSGTAVARFAPGTIGAHTVKAVFLGTASASTSTSAPQTVAVTGTYPTSSTISASGVPGNYSLTGTVVGLGSPTLAPTGNVTFNDTTNSSALGSAPLGDGALAFSAVQPFGSPAKAGAGAYGVATGDFNGDGYLDVVTENYSANTVSILLGKGDGTFQPQVAYAVGSSPERVLVADFNGDGYLDLVVANTGSGTVSVLLGNGDGTFQAQVTYPAASPVGLGVMDINHDGIPDIVAAGYYANSFSVLLGKGDGTFQPAVTYPTGHTPQTLAEGDFNGDGNVDLAIGNLNDNTVGVFLGNGDGTFQSQVTYPVGRQPQGVQAGDLNGDGFEDLAVTNSADGTVGVLLGNGNGTFQPQVTYPVGSSPVGLVVADFNGDGKQDISVGNTAQSSLTQSILLGNGDGTFQPQVTFPTGNFPYGVAAGDFNGDGFPDLAISDFSDATATILLSQVTQTASATLSGAAVGNPTGTHTADASYPGDASFSTSTSQTIPLLSSTLASSTTSLAITPSTQTVGQAVLFSVTVAATSETSAAPSGTVTLTNNAVTPATILGTISLGETGTGSLSLSTLPIGTYAVVATYNGSTTFASSASPSVPLTIAKASTATSLAISAAALNAGQSETLTASIQGGTTPAETGSVAFSDQYGPLGSMAVTPSVTGSTATLTLSTLSAGTHRIIASYSGDATYAASASGIQTVVVSLISQTITFPPIPNHGINDAPFTVTATASSELPVAFSVLSGPATIAGNVVTLTGAGTVTIQATQPGNATYAAASPVSQSFTVAPLIPTLASVSPASGVVGMGATTITLTGTNFNTGDSVLLNNTAIASTYVSATSLSATLPASFFASAGTGQIAVHDPASNTTTAPISFAVVSTPSVVFSGPSSASSGQQPSVTFQLVNPYPFPLTGAITLTFVPSSSSAPDDPAVQFATGGRTLPLSIAANSTTTPAVQLQTGTVAGTVTVTLALTSNGVDVTPTTIAPVVIVIAPAVPNLTAGSPTLTRSGQTLTLALTGFSNTREITKAIFHFTPIAGALLNNPDITLDSSVAAAFQTWFSSAPSATYGSQFLYTQPFTLDVDAGQVKGVTVTLVNTIGSSTSITIQ